MTSVLTAPAHGAPPTTPAPPAPPEPPERAVGRAQAASTAALTVLTLAAAVGMRRLFAGWSYLGPVAVAAVAAHGVAWWCRRRELPAWLAAAAPPVVAVLAASWTVLPQTTFLGIPTGSTLHTASSALSTAFRDFTEVVAPAPVNRGFVLALVLAVVLAASLADWAAYRMGAAVEATIPSFVLFLFTAALGSAKGRSWSVALELGALLGFVLVHTAGTQSRRRAWFASRSSGASPALLRTGVALAAVAVAAAVLLGPEVPGAGSRALVAWRKQDRGGTTSRSTVSPFVDIRGRLVDNSQVEVFTVRSQDRAYWRLTSLDAFDGNIWSSNDAYRAAHRRLAADEPVTGGAELAQQFSVEALSSIWLPAAYQPVRFDGSGDASYSYNADSNSIISSHDTADGLTYTVVSRMPRLTGEQLATAPPLAPGQMSHYLELPAIPSRVASLAHSIVAGRQSEYDQARALQDYLRSNYRYDINTRLGHSGNAVAEFLFGKAKKGYCEQFAGSYAVMARAVGLPTRVAVGFTPGQQQADGLFHVRDEHAHAWPEVYFPTVGWVAFEPTPGRGAPGAESYTGVPENQEGGAAGAPAETPTTAAPSATTPTSGGPSTANSTPRRPGEKDPASGPTAHHRSRLVPAGEALLALALLAGAWCAAVPGLRRLRRDRRRSAARRPEERVLVAWREANGALRREGAGRLDHETLAEHAHRAAAAVGLEPQAGTSLARLAGIATAASYGNTGLTPDAATQAVAAAAGLEQALAARASRGTRFKRAVDPRL